MDYVKVMLSPHYRGRGWTDEATGISFEPVQSPRPVRIPKDGKDLSGIRNSVRLNNLLLLEGEFTNTPAEPTKYNPEELTKEQFHKLVDGIASGDNSELQAQLDAANQTIADLQQQVADLEAQLSDQEDGDVKAAFVEDDDAERRAELQAKTVTQLKEMADGLDVEYTSNVRKDDLIDAIIAKEKELAE